MKKTFKILLMLFVAIFSAQSCGRDDSPAQPVDETNDRGHEMPNKVELIFTDVASHAQQKKTGLVTKDGMKYDSDAPFIWKEGRQYHLELVYYHDNVRMNSEFVTEKMAMIHQHFFELFEGEYPKTKDDRNKMVEQMDQLVSYEYQDTNPENGYIGQGAQLRKRTWDKENPTAVDPIGLKGIFNIKENLQSKEYKLLIRLAHFQTVNKLDGGKARKYNEIPNIGFVPDIGLTLPVKIEK